MNGLNVSRALRGWGSAFCVIVAALAMAACAAQGPRRPEPPPTAATALPPRNELPSYFRLPNASPERTPVRVALLLPFSSSSAETRALANAIEKSAELAVFDSGNPDILLMPRDDGGTTGGVASAASRAISEGAEIILGPLFAQSVTVVGPIARQQGVPVIAFSSDRSVAGQGVYLLSFQPEDEVRRIVTYAARHGHTQFAAMVPQNAYGEKAAAAFQRATAEAGARVTSVQSFAPKPEEITAPSVAVAATKPDAILIAQGGVVLRSIAPTLALNGATNRSVKFLGTGLWDDTSIMREPMLAGGWFAAPSLEGERSFAEKYRSVYGAPPPRLASLGYDAVSLVTLLAKGAPYQRYTPAALTDPNGFAGVDGIFRFHEDGSAERGLAIMEVQPNGFVVVAPAPSTFQPGT